MRTTKFAPFAFLLLLWRVDSSDFPQSCFDWRRWIHVHVATSFCSSFSQETLKFLSTVIYFKNNCSIIMNHDTCQWWQMLQTSKCPSRLSWSLFNQWKTSIPGEKGIYFFPKMSTVILFISVSTTYPVVSSVLPLCVDIQLSHDSIHGFQQSHKNMTNRGLWTV